MKRSRKLTQCRLRPAHWLGARLPSALLPVLVSFCFELHSQPSLTVRALPETGDVSIIWHIDDPGPGSSQVYQLQKSTDLNHWANVWEIDLRPQTLPLESNEYRDPKPGPICFYRLTTSGTVIATAASGAELFGFTSEMARALANVGELSVEAFLKRYSPTEPSLERISYDPTKAEFWEEVNTPITPPRPVFPPDPFRDVRQHDFSLSDDEMEVFMKQGFVIRGRKGSHSFADLYYRIFSDDLPVFVSLDSVLHAWHRNYISMLKDLEEMILADAFNDIIKGMTEQLPTIAEDVSPALRPSLHDADIYLTVARSLYRVRQAPTSLGQSDAEVTEILEHINRKEPILLSLFGRTNPEIVDFSQFKPRGHYTRSKLLTRYFQAAMWCGRVDFRVAGPKNLASPRELGTALILQEAMSRAGKLDTWRQFDQILQTFVGLTDSMTVPQLQSILKAAGITSVSQVTTIEQLRQLQEQIESGDLGTQIIASHGFYASRSGPSLTLPRSFTLMGQKFVMDSWAMGQLVFDRIHWQEKKVNRRLPSAVDIAFTVLGNRSAADLLGQRIRNTEGVPYRDGYPIQHQLGALHDVFAAMPAEHWKSNIYTSWLFALRQYTQTPSPTLPEVFRTKEWARKTMGTQLASWTHLRHGTVLYAKQSATLPLLCDFPSSYVEPHLDAWKALADMAATAESMLAELEVSGQATFNDGPFGFPQTLSRKTVITRQQNTMRHFRQTCENLAAIVEKQLAQEPLDSSQSEYLKDMLEIMLDYVGQRTYSGWYPRLFYSRTPDQLLHPSDLWDPVVTDVHTDFPEDGGDPGTILHQGVGSPALMLISVDCTGRHVYLGPVSTYYEFTSGSGNFDRMTDEEWKRQLQIGPAPLEPEWTSGHRFPGRVSIPDWAIE